MHQRNCTNAEWGAGRWIHEEISVTYLETRQSVDSVGSVMIFLIEYLQLFYIIHLLYLHSVLVFAIFSPFPSSLRFLIQQHLELLHTLQERVLKSQWQGIMGDVFMRLTSKEVKHKSRIWMLHSLWIIVCFTGSLDLSFWLIWICWFKMWLFTEQELLEMFILAWVVHSAVF